MTTGFPTLPCYPCPHGAACCDFGTTLTDDEAAVISAAHGAALVYRTPDGEWRTRVVEGKCAFLKASACTLYHQAYYPAVCRGFPWTDAETGGPYESDRTICPEFVQRPHLLQIHPFRGGDQA